MSRGADRALKGGGGESLNFKIVSRVFVPFLSVLIAIYKLIQKKRGSDDPSDPLYPRP